MDGGGEAWLLLDVLAFFLVFGLMQVDGKGDGGRWACEGDGWYSLKYLTSYDVDLVENSYEKRRSTPPHNTMSSSKIATPNH